MINVGLVGYGLGGKVFHAPFINLTEQLRLHGVCSRTVEKRQDAANDYEGIATYEHFEELLGDPDVDLVVLATPHETHAPMAIQAMEAGKHLVTDKVMCLNESEALAMMEASERNKVLLSVFQNRRWDGDFLTLKDILGSGILGDVYTVESNITAFGGPHSGWRAWKMHGGGRTRDWGAHLVDQALQLFGPTVEWVFADYQFRYPESASDVESTSHCLLKFKNGVRCFIELGSAWIYPKPRYHVRGSDGGFRKYGLDPQEATIKLGAVGVPVPEDPARYQMKTKGREGEVQEVTVTPRHGAYRTYYDNIGAVLDLGEELLVKPEESLEVIKTIDAIVTSAECAEVVRMK